MKKLIPLLLTLPLLFGCDTNSDTESDEGYTGTFVIAPRSVTLSTNNLSSTFDLVGGYSVVTNQVGTSTTTEVVEVEWTLADSTLGTLNVVNPRYVIYTQTDITKNAINVINAKDPNGLTATASIEFQQ